MDSLEAIHLAALYAGPQVLELLVDSRFKVDHPTTCVTSTFNLWTPLHFAASVANFPAIDWLVQNGANSFARTGQSQTPIHISISHCHQIGPSRVKSTVEHLISHLSHTDGLNIEDSHGMTGLDLAKAGGLTETTQLLLEHGATENSREKVRRLSSPTLASL